MARSPSGAHAHAHAQPGRGRNALALAARAGISGEVSAVAPLRPPQLSASHRRRRCSLLFPEGHSRCNPLQLERRLKLGQRDYTVAVEVDRTDHLVKDLVAGVEAEAKQRCFELRRVDGAIAVLVEELEELRL